MSYTEIYKFKENGEAESFAEIKNAFRGAMAIWQILEARYLPKYRPSWAILKDTDYSRVSDYTGQGIKEIWALFDGTEISETDKIVLGSTFDKVVVMKEDLPALIQAFGDFEGETSLKEQAQQISKLMESGEDFLAIAWNQTSVSDGSWSEYSEEAEEELPYNLLTGSKHWNLFDDIKKANS